MALETNDGPDCIIGVFGLPEIIINTLLLATIGDDFEIRFRIASNSMLDKPYSESLKDRFSFTEKEIRNITDLQLDTESVYSKDLISKDLTNVCFAATALTKDIVTGLNGISKVDSKYYLETIFSAYEDATVQLVTVHKLNNRINYSACFTQRIDDLSIISIIDNDELIANILSLYAELEKNLLNQYLINAKIEDLHVTLFEFGIHYGGFNNKELFNECVKEAAMITKKLKPYFIYQIEGLEIRDDSIYAKVIIEEELSSQLDRISTANVNFFNVMRRPEVFHITIARFKKYIELSQIEGLFKICEEINQRIKNISGKSKLQLTHIIATPFIRNNI